jgi:predicted nucleic acid-binding protein
VNVLVDSSVWVGHFKQRNEHLVTLLETGLVVCHPYVVAEVAYGTPPSRKVIISMLGELESTPVATQEELLAMLDTQQLYGRGYGFVDISLLAAALLLGNVRIWTLDKRLELMAGEFDKSYQPVLHS